MRKAIPVIAYAYLVFIIMASLGRFIIGILPKGIKNSDKIGHALAYLVFVVIWGSFFLLKSKNNSIQNAGFKAVAFAIIFGILMEVAQWGLTSYRQFDIFDMMANTFGAILGLLFFNILTKYSGIMKKIGV